MYGQDSERTMSLSSNKSSFDLSLSYSFSDTKSSASEDDSLESASNAVVEPYTYKPLASDSEADISLVEDESQDNQRLLNTNW